MAKQRVQGFPGEMIRKIIEAPYRLIYRILPNRIEIVMAITWRAFVALAAVLRRGSTNSTQKG